MEFSCHKSISTKIMLGHEISRAYTLKLDKGEWLLSNNRETIQFPATHDLVLNNGKLYINDTVAVEISKGKTMVYTREARSI